VALSKVSWNCPKSNGNNVLHPETRSTAKILYFFSCYEANIQTFAKYLKTEKMSDYVAYILCFIIKYSAEYTVLCLQQNILLKDQADIYNIRSQCIGKGFKHYNIKIVE
jgi:hypothetical protein